LNLRGWTRNLRDGRVEALAQGSSDLLDLFEAKLKKGPVHGQVESVAVQMSSSEEPLDGFAIRKDSE
jgi:acylphosphatase